MSVKIHTGGGGLLQRIILALYKYSLRDVQKVFFENTSNKDFMLEHHIISGRYEVLPGAGVNLSEHCYEIYPNETEEMIFTFIGRIVKDKGTDEFIEAARVIKKQYPRIKFRIIGSFVENYESKVKALSESGIIEYIPEQKNIHPFITQSHAIIHPSYHEGMSNILLEAAATGRPVIASKVAGCIETFDEGVSGIDFEARNSEDLVRAIRKFIMLPYSQKIEMGKNGRIKMEREFDRRKVTAKYLEELEAIK